MLQAEFHEETDHPNNMLCTNDTTDSILLYFRCVSFNFLL
jgi:hypothetical protein